jgi:hypothetical protein
VGPALGVDPMVVPSVPHRTQTVVVLFLASVDSTVGLPGALSSCLSDRCLCRFFLFFSVLALVYLDVLSSLPPPSRHCYLPPTKSPTKPYSPQQPRTDSPRPTGATGTRQQRRAQQQRPQENEPSRGRRLHHLARATIESNGCNRKHEQVDRKKRLRRRRRRPEG